jgi:hypothetical protein
MGHLTALLPGFVLGCIVVFTAWGISALIVTSSRRKTDARNDELVTSIESKWTEIDSVITSFKTGKITESAFKKGVIEKVEAVNRLYKPMLHRLDIFFVKYTEKLLEEYQQMAMGNAAAAPAKNDRAAFAADQTVFQEQEAAAPQEFASVQDEARETGYIAVVEPHEEVPSFEAQPAPEAPVESLGQISIEPTLETPVIEVEPIVTSMTESASEGEDAMPLETFLEMEPNAIAAGEAVPLEQEIVTENFQPQQDQEQPAPMPYEPKQEPSAEPASEETGVTGEAVFETRQSVADQPLYPAVEGQTAQTEFIDDTLLDQSSFEFAAPEIGGAETTEQSADTIPMMPPPYAPPQRERAPGYKRDESVEPATIFDIEAETIIADRSEILGVKKAPAKEEQEHSKSSLGITGEDISDQLDNFFNIK